MKLRRTHDTPNLFVGRGDPTPPGDCGKLEFVEILIGHIVVLDLPGGFHWRMK